jgi:lipoate-protein ligase B
LSPSAFNIIRGEEEVSCAVCQLGLIEYSAAYHLQKRLALQRREGQISDMLLLLEHPPTITVGKSGKLDNLLVSREQLVEKGISLFFADRGGDVTYHGPGQLIAYPIIDLKRRGEDIRRYVHDLEEVIVRTLDDFCIKAHRDDTYIGVWVGERKIAAIGISVKRWVAIHGFALNVRPNCEYFSLIKPCGIPDKGVTSISEVLSQDVPMEAVTERVVAYFSEVFGARIQSGSNILGSRL